MTSKIIQARVLTSAYQERMDITFNDQSGLIEKVEPSKSAKENVDFYFDDDHLLLGGMGDIHIHAREDITGKNTYKEDFHSTCCAAINGGVVLVADMPNNPVAPVNDETYLDKLALTKQHPLPILLYAGIGPSTRPLTFTVPYKVYMGPSIGELYFKTNHELDEVLQHYRDCYVSFHCEDPEILEAHKDEATHETRRPLSAELMATDVALALIEKYNLKGKLCHYSAKDGLSKIRSARARGLCVTTEVTPQHLYFSSEKIQKEIPANEQVYFQMNPPIRGEADKEALLEALRSGEIDYLATDHAPHSPEEKARGMSGLPGLDTYGAFVTWLLLEQKIDPVIIAKVCVENPAHFTNHFLQELKKQDPYFVRFGNGFGHLETGYSASFTVLNLKRPITITREKLQTKARWSPFLGVTFPGSVAAVFIGGKKKSV